MSVGQRARGLRGRAAEPARALLRLVVWPLSGFRLGRLMGQVSVPRMLDHRARTILTVFGVALGVAVLVAVSAVNQSVLRALASTVDDIAGTTDLQISAGTSGFREELLDEVRATRGVLKAAPIVQQTVTVRDAQARGERLLVLGVDMLERDDGHFRSYGSAELAAIRDDPLAFLNSSQNVLLSRSVARRFGYRVHDKIALATGSGVLPFEVWGFLDEAGVGRAFGGAVAVMYHQAMQVAFGREHNIDRIDVAVAPGEDIALVAQRLRARVGDGFLVERPSQRGQRVGEMIAGVRAGLTAASLVALLVGAFLIHSTVSISVVQRKRELGILRALGARRREIVALLTLEGALLGALGSLLGVVLGIGLSELVLRSTSLALNQTFVLVAVDSAHVDGWVVALGLALGTVAATLASALPARVAAHNQPAVTLRTGQLGVPAATRHFLRRSDLLAALLLIASMFIAYLPAVGAIAVGGVAAQICQLLAGALLLPRLVQLLERALGPLVRSRASAAARLATESLPRDPQRTASAIGALMTGVALCISFAIFTHSFGNALSGWIDQTLPGDLFITQGASIGGTSMRNVPMIDSLFEPLTAIPEVESVRRVRVVELPYRGTVLKAAVTDIGLLSRHGTLPALDGDAREIAARLQRGEVAVSENLARRFSVRRGDELALSTSRGTRGFKVAGIVVDYTSDLGTIIFDRPTYVAAFQDDRVDTYELYLRDPRAVERVRHRIHAEYGERHDLFVLTNREFRAEVNKSVEQVFRLMRALELVALIVAVLGILNTQLANILDRVREIGVLRAIGMLRGQVVRMVVIEAALMGAVGTIAGALVGALTGHVLLIHINLVQTGWYFPYRFSFASLAEVASLTVAASVLAGIYPARQAARLVITEALEYE